MHAGHSLATFSPGYRPHHEPHHSRPRFGRHILWLGGLALAAALHWGMPAFWNWKHVVSSSGGRYFVHRVVIPVPAFQQNDPRWSLQLLGDTIDTLGQAGCAVSSAAMVLAAYGVDTDPQRLNQYLTAHGGYVGDGWLVWEKAAEVGGGQVEKAYEDAPSYALLDQNLLKGNPVIVRLTLRNGHTHFVVLVGKQGWDYLARDPARSPAWGIYPLKQLTGRIQALRFYRIVPVPLTAAPVLASVPKTTPSPAAAGPPPVAVGAMVISPVASLPKLQPPTHAQKVSTP